MFSTPPTVSPLLALLSLSLCLASHSHSLSLSSFLSLPATAAVVGELIYATASIVFFLVFSVTFLRNRNKFIVCIFSAPPKASWPIKKMAKNGKGGRGERCHKQGQNVLLVGLMETWRTFASVAQFNLVLAKRSCCCCHCCCCCAFRFRSTKQNDAHTAEPRTNEGHAPTHTLHAPVHFWRCQLWRN